MKSVNNIEEAIEKTGLLKLVLCSVHDSKTREFQTPMGMRTIDEAIRSFSAACTEEGHQFKKFKSDYTLWTMGYYYPQTGTIENIDKMQIAAATDF